MTKTQLIADYRAAILDLASRDADMAWVYEGSRLQRFMSSVETTIRTERATWNHNSNILAHVWRAGGLKGKPTLKAMRALPE
jgi:hypothetical protein